MSSDDLVSALSFRDLAVDLKDGTGDLGNLMEWSGGLGNLMEWTGDLGNLMEWSGDLASTSDGDLVGSSGNPVDWSGDLTCWTGTSMAPLIVRYNANTL